MTEKKNLIHKKELFKSSKSKKFRKIIPKNFKISKIHTRSNFLPHGLVTIKQMQLGLQSLSVLLVVRVLSDGLLDCHLGGLFFGVQEGKLLVEPFKELDHRREVLE
jgi:hypothetical protein